MAYWGVLWWGELWLSPVTLRFDRIIFTSIYTVEMIGKIIGLGFFAHKHAYLRDSWNWLDFIVVILR